MANYSFEVDYSEDSDYNLSDFYYDTASPCGMERNHQVEHIMQLYVNSITCILGLVGNILVIVTYTLYKRTKSMTDVYLLNVAAADLMFVVVLPLIIYNEQHNWDMGNWACKLLRGMYSINLYSGTLLLACISGDRYISIVHSEMSIKIGSQSFGHFICVAVWLLAFALSVPTFIYNQRYNVNDVNNDVNYDYMDYGDSMMNTSFSPRENEAICYFWFHDNSSAHLMKIFASLTMSIGFLLPSLIMGFSYSHTVITLTQAKNLHRHKALWVIIAMAVVSIACHLPYNVTLLYDIVVFFSVMSCNEKEGTLLALTVTESLAYLHCCLNPAIYAFIGVKVRNHFCKKQEEL